MALIKKLRMNDIIVTRDGAMYVWDGIVGRKGSPEDKFFMDFIRWDVNGKAPKFSNNQKDIVKIYRVFNAHFQNQKTEAYQFSMGKSIPSITNVVWEAPKPKLTPKVCDCRNCNPRPTVNKGRYDELSNLLKGKTAEVTFTIKF